MKVLFILDVCLSIISLYSCFSGYVLRKILKRIMCCVIACPKKGFIVVFLFAITVIKNLCVLITDKSGVYRTRHARLLFSCALHALHAVQGDNPRKKPRPKFSYVFYSRKLSTFVSIMILIIMC